MLQNNSKSNKIKLLDNIYIGGEGMHVHPVGIIGLPY